MKRVRSSIFSRLVLGMVVVYAVAIAGSVSFLYLRFEAMNSRFRDDTLRTFVDSILRDEHSADKTSPYAPSSSVAKRIEAAGGSYAIVSSIGGILAGTSGVADALVPPEDRDESYFMLRHGGDEASTFGLSVRIIEPGSTPYYIQVAFPSNEVIFDSVLEEFIGDIAWIWIPCLLGILVINVIVARYVLKPLARAARQVELVGPGSLKARLNVGRTPAEVGTLVGAVNRAFDRLQVGQAALEEFVADVAHELRTPLAVIKAQLSGSQPLVSRELGQDFDRMERLVLQLLDRVKLGGLHFEPEDRVNLCELARDSAAFMAPIAVARHRLIEVIAPDGPVVVCGAYDYLFRALRNLIENAIEHTPPGSTVSVIVQPGATITVVDRGPGFPARRLDPLARRHAPLRSDRFEGVGLGLSIVERTMAGHLGRLELSNLPEGGGSATLWFPPLGPEPDQAFEGSRHENSLMLPRADLEPVRQP